MAKSLHFHTKHANQFFVDTPNMIKQGVRCHTKYLQLFFVVTPNMPNKSCFHTRYAQQVFVFLLQTCQTILHYHTQHAKQVFLVTPNMANKVFISHICHTFLEGYCLVRFLYSHFVTVAVSNPVRQFRIVGGIIWLWGSPWIFLMNFCFHFTNGRL